MEALKEEQECEEGDEARGEVIPEHGERQARLSHRIPRALDEVLVVDVENEAGLDSFTNTHHALNSKGGCKEPYLHLCSP